MPTGFHPVLVFPEAPVLLDLSGRTPPSDSGHRYSIGRYNETRNIYTQELFGGERNIHIGIDLGAPAGTEVTAFTDCTLYAFGNNDSDGDYGPTLVTEQEVNGAKIWALYGHLSLCSLEGKVLGMAFKAGQRIGQLGPPHENGGWPPHLHFQLAKMAPDGADMPGAVRAEELNQALRDYPDPRTVLGPLY